MNLNIRRVHELGLHQSLKSYGEKWAKNPPILQLETSPFGLELLRYWVMYELFLLYTD